MVGGEGVEELRGKGGVVNGAIGLLFFELGDDTPDAGGGIALFGGEGVGDAGGGGFFGGGVLAQR